MPNLLPYCQWCKKQTQTFTTAMGAYVCVNCGEWKNSPSRRQMHHEAHPPQNPWTPRMDAHEERIARLEAKPDAMMLLANTDHLFRRIEELERNMPRCHGAPTLSHFLTSDLESEIERRKQAK